MGDQYLGGQSPSEWNLEGLVGRAARDGPRRPETSEEALDEAAESREVLIEHLRDLVDGRLEARRPSTARRSGPRSSGSCCCARSTACGSSTSPSSTTCAGASASAATPSRTRSTSSARRRSASTRSCRDLIRRQVATTIFRVTVRREPATVPLPGPAQPARPSAAARSRRAAARRVAVGTSGAAAGAAGARRGRGAAGRPLAGGQAALRQPAPGPRRIRPPIRGLAADPMRSAREVPGDAKATDGVDPARVHPVGDPDRPQRAVLVRVRPEVQEVSRGLTRDRSQGSRAPPC